MAEVKHTELLAALGQSMGQEKANEVINETTGVLGLAADEWTRDQALKILDKIGETPGLVGSAAKLTRTKMHLRWAKLGAAAGRA